MTEDEELEWEGEPTPDKVPERPLHVYDFLFDFFNLLRNIAGSFAAFFGGVGDNFISQANLDRRLRKEVENTVRDIERL